MNTHELKCWPGPFQALIKGDKRFEFRKNDRGFKLGDKLVLREYDPLKAGYTGIVAVVNVTFILESGFGLPEEYCIMSIRIERIEVW